MGVGIIVIIALALKTVIQLPTARSFRASGIMPYGTMVKSGRISAGHR